MAVILRSARSVCPEPRGGHRGLQRGLLPCSVHRRLGRFFKVFRERIGGGLFLLADGFQFVTEGGKPGVQGQQAGSSLLIHGAFLSVYRLFFSIARVFDEKGLTFRKIVLYYKYIEPMGVSPSQALRRTRVAFATLIYFC